MKYIKLFFAAALLTLLTSCGGTEPNDLAYVVGIGFDKAESDGSYIITIQYAEPTKISGGASEEGGSGGSEIVENMAVEAPNLYAGLSVANHIVSKKLSLSHAKIVVFSADVAKDGISDIMETITRNEEIRPDIYLAVAADSARNYLFSVDPSIEVNPAKYYQLIYEGDSTQGIPSNSALEVYFNYKNGGKDNVLPLAGITSSEKEESESSLPQVFNLGDDYKEESENGGGEEGGQEPQNGEEDGQQSQNSQEMQGGQQSQSEGQEEESGGSESGESGDSDPSKEENVNQKSAVKTDGSFDFNLRDYIAGQVAVNNSNKSESMGMVVFKGDKAQFITGSVETNLYKMLTGDFKEIYLTVKSDENEAVTLKTEQERKPSTKIDMKNGKITISMSLESDLYSMPASYVSEKDIENFEKTAAEEITLACEKFINDVIKENSVDILGFKEKAKSSFLTNNEYEQKRDEVMDYEVDVNVEFVIRRTGLTLWKE
ncbi:MAG: hypothetical protein LUD03_06375 [Firmicutes bacterium]|nr:hypothetical protein [Bacillota bacterium]